MKKLLTLAVILGLASMASAGLLISVDGIVDPPDSSITIAPSDVVILDIYNTAAGFEGYWVLYCQTSCGTISGGYIAITDPDVASMCFIDNDAVGNGYIPLEPGANGVWGGAFGSISPAKAVPAGVIYDGIEFHCEAPGDCVVILQQVTDMWELGVIYDTQIIHQIPEPATIALLCLGGLLLRKK